VQNLVAVSHPMCAHHVGGPKNFGDAGALLPWDTAFNYGSSRQHLRSASRRQLVVPRYRLSACGRRAFAVAGPSVWNSLPDNLRDPAVGSDSLRRSLKTFLFIFIHQ